MNDNPKNTDFNQVFAHEIKNKLYENKFSKTHVKS